MRDGGGSKCIAIGGCDGCRVALRGLRVHVQVSGGGRRRWCPGYRCPERAECPQVIAIAIGERQRSERIWPFRGKRKLEDIGCFCGRFFSAENILRGGRLR